LTIVLSIASSMPAAMLYYLTCYSIPIIYSTIEYCCVLQVKSGFVVDADVKVIARQILSIVSQVKRDRDLRQQSEAAPVKPTSTDHVQNVAPVAMPPLQSNTAVTMPGQVMTSLPGVGVSGNQLGMANAPQAVASVPTMTTASTVVQTTSDAISGHGVASGHPPPSTVSSQIAGASSHPVIATAAQQPVAAVGVFSSTTSTVPAMIEQTPLSSGSVTMSSMSAHPIGKTILMQLIFGLRHV